MPVPSLPPDLLERARRLAAGPGRRVLGIAGGPGAGKSTLADALGEALGPVAAVVGMDGWHLATSTLERLGRVERKGAPDTFDAIGYAAFLVRVRGDDGAVVWAPEYRRSVEEPIAGALAVDPRVRLVITEGNYLLLDDGPWALVRGLLDECWFLGPEESVRRARLVARHVAVGRSEADAAARADGPDATNARLVAGTAGRADLVVG